MAKKETTSPAIPVFPMLKTVEQMSKISGIGENKPPLICQLFNMPMCKFIGILAH